MKYNCDEIKKIIPHRHPFLLIDKIIDGEEGKYAVGIKNISISDPVFQGHFPEHNVYPGVLIIEAVAQVGAVAILAHEENKRKIALFAGIKNAKFKREVLPGDTLKIKCELEAIRANIGFARGKVYVDDSIVSECSISFAIKEI